MEFSALAALGIHDLSLFVIASVLLIVTPGPDMLYVMGQSSLRGLRAGLLAGFGTGFGCSLHVTFAAVGLTTLLATSAAAFTVIKFVGAAYLVYLGLQLLGLRLRGQSPAEASVTTTAAPRAPNPFWQAVLINATNPKVALFFLAFLPQFIRADSAHKTLTFFLLGLSFGFVGMSWNLLMAWIAARLKDQLARSARFGRWLNKALGCVFLGFGLKLALSQRA